MLQSEFEERIGKKVDVEIFEMYNKMYMSIDADKNTFISLLDISIIPESESTIKARKEREKLIEEKEKEIERIKLLIHECEVSISYDWYTRTNTQKIKEYKSQIRELKNQIQLLKID